METTLYAWLSLWVPVGALLYLLTCLTFRDYRKGGNVRYTFLFLKIMTVTWLVLATVTLFFVES